LKTARSDDVDRTLQAWVAVVLPGAQLESWDSKHLDEPLLPLELSASLLVPSFMVPENGHLVAEQFFEAPIAMHALGMPSLGAYLRLPSRNTPLWVSELGEEMTVSVALPEGSQPPVEAPKSFKEETSFGRFVQEFTWDAKTKRAKLVVAQSTKAQRISAKEFPKFRDAAQQILQSSRNRLIVPVGAVEQAKK
jgi:hypothetical protein